MTAACRDGGESGAPTTTTTAPPSPSTSTTATAPYKAGGLSPGAIDEGKEQWLTAPTAPTTKGFTSDCRTMADAGWEASCERVTSALGEAVWIKQRRGEQERVLLYVRRSDDAWDLSLRAADDSGREFDAEVATADLAGDGNPKIVVKLRAHETQVDRENGVNAPVHVDVVEPNGTIVVHLVLFGHRAGRPDASPRPGQGLEATDCPSDCVPTAPMRTRLIAYRDNAWRVIEERRP